MLTNVNKKDQRYGNSAHQAKVYSTFYVPKAGEELKYQQPLRETSNLSLVFLLYK